MAILLDLPNTVQPALQFGDVGIQTIPSGSQLFIRMSDDTPSIIKGVTGSFEVSDGSKVVQKGQFGPFNMAPKTEIGCPVFWLYLKSRKQKIVVPASIFCRTKVINFTS
jgi:hypothetical protein